MTLTLLELAVSFAVGVALQRHRSRGRLRSLLWIGSFYAIVPVSAFYAISVLPLERRTSLLTLLNPDVRSRDP